MSANDFGRRTSVPSRPLPKGFTPAWTTPREKIIAESTDTPEVEMLRHFMGENAEKFLRLRKDYGPRTLISFNIAAFFAPLAWFFYRKMYIWGALLLLVPIVLVMVFPALEQIPSAGFAGAIAVAANSAYLGFATGRVKKLRARAENEGLSDDEFIELLESKGGVSVAGAVFGAMITLSLIALVFMSAASA